MKRGRMAMREAMGLVPDDLPDGAFFAMAHEIAGLDYGDGFAELAEEATGLVGPRRRSGRTLTAAQKAKRREKRRRYRARRAARKAEDAA